MTELVKKPKSSEPDWLRRWAMYYPYVSRSLVSIDTFCGANTILVKYPLRFAVQIIASSCLRQVVRPPNGPTLGTFQLSSTQTCRRTARLQKPSRRHLGAMRTAHPRYHQELRWEKCDVRTFPSGPSAPQAPRARPSRRGGTSSQPRAPALPPEGPARLLPRAAWALRPRSLGGRSPEQRGSRRPSPGLRRSPPRPPRRRLRRLRAAHRARAWMASDPGRRRLELRTVGGAPRRTA